MRRPLGGFRGGHSPLRIPPGEARAARPRPGCRRESDHHPRPGPPALSGRALSGQPSDGPLGRSGVLRDHERDRREDREADHLTCDAIQHVLREPHQIGLDPPQPALREEQVGLLEGPGADHEGDAEGPDRGQTLDPALSQGPTADLHEGGVEPGDWRYPGVCNHRQTTLGARRGRPTAPEVYATNGRIHRNTSVTSTF